MEIVIIILFIIGIVVAIVYNIVQASDIASEAERKGYDPEEFERLSYGEGRHIVRLLVDSLPDLTENNDNEEISNIKPHPPKEQISKKIYIRNLYVNIPFRPYDSKIYINDNGKIAHKIYLKNYEEVDCDSIRVTVKDYDGFENLLYETSLTAANLEKTSDGFSFVSVIDSDNVVFDIVCYLEVYVEAYAKGPEYVKFEEAQKCSFLMPVADFIAFKQQYGEDAIQPYEEYEDHWVCVCGNQCKKDSLCAVCGRALGKTDNGKLGFLNVLSQLSDIEEIKTEFMGLKGLIPDTKFNDVLKYIDEFETLKRVYGIKEISNENRDKIIEMINEA